MNFFERISKNPYLSDFMNVQFVGAELFRVGRETDRRERSNDKANNRLSQFCELA